MTDGPVRGLDQDLADKAAAKYDPKREADARYFIETVTGETFASDNFQASLKDGVLLAKLMNKILPSDPIKVSTSKIAFKQMENIGFFLNRLSKVGVPTYEQFQTVDLYEGKNIDQVVNCIFSLSRHAAAKGLDVPVLGPKLTAKVERTFTEEQLNQSKSILPRLTGFVAKSDGPGPFGGRREIGGVYMDSNETVDNVEAAVAKVAISEPAPTPVAAPAPAPAPVAVPEPVADPAPVMPAPIPEPVAVASIPEPTAAPIAPVALAPIPMAEEKDSAFDKLDRIVREAEEEIQRAKEAAALAKKKEDDERAAYKARIAAFTPPAPVVVEEVAAAAAAPEPAVVSPSGLADAYIDSYYGGDDDEEEEVVIIEEDDDADVKVMYSSKYEE
ncbi:hypothetical protein HDU97_007770 [Phlyctochytrium planicorne]|nr:hypothetical protein HDU97_007770 [Phlyctochytrium planicorne]